MDNHAQRVISGFAYAGLMLGCAWLGPWPFGGLLLLLLLIAMGEMARLSASAQLSIRVFLAVALVLSFGALAYIRAVFWPGITFGLLMGAFVFDSAAYYAGRVLGGPKLIPKISPNKTWSGLIFGGIAIAICYFGYALWFWFIFANSGSTYYAVTGLFISGGIAIFYAAVLSGLFLGGDISISWLKRRAGLKDTGRLIPGHGGILDRMDSLLIAAPVLALYYHLIQGFDW